MNLTSTLLRVATSAVLGIPMVLGILALVPSAFAHDLQTVVRVELPYVAVEASYEGEEAGSFLPVSVHAPADGKADADAFQTGRTDLRGKFVFLPDRPGVWRITVDDELGHRVSEDITITDLAMAGTVAGGMASQVGSRSAGDKLLVGLSLLIGATGLLMAWMSRRRSQHAA